MRESSLVPTNLLNWPRVAGRLPEEKFVLMALWSSPFLSCAGCGLVALNPFAASLGFSADACQTNINNLVEAGLVMADADTGEIFILDWFRFHIFKTPIQRNMLLQAIQKTQSAALKSVILEKSTTCFPTTTTTSTSTSTSTKNTPLPPKGGVGDGEDESTNEKTITGGADAPVASREKSAQQEKDGVTVATLVSGDLFHETQDFPQTVPPAGSGLAGDPPGSAAPPVLPDRKKRVAKVADEPIVLPEWIKPEDWAAFVKHREAVKKPMSAEAQKRGIALLERLRAEGNDPSAVINQSIISGWTGFFPVNNRGRASAVPQSRQAVRDVMSGMHHGFDKKDYSAGVTADGRLID